jgi:hypothetical protein
MGFGSAQPCWLRFSGLISGIRDEVGFADPVGVADSSDETPGLVAEKICCDMLP